MPSRQRCGSSPTPTSASSAARCRRRQAHVAGRRPRSTSTVYEHDGRIYGSFRHALEHFTACVRSNAEPLTSAERVFGVVAALEAIHQSLQSGKPERVEASLPAMA